jgi:hypothetical protein
MNDATTGTPKKKEKALYGKLINDLYYSSKTIKCNKQLDVRLEFVADYKEAMAEEREPRQKSQLALSIINNEDGTATMTIRGNKDIKVEDKRGELS